MRFTKSDFAQAEGGILIGIAIIIIIAVIVVTNWDTISNAISQFMKATCVDDPRWSFNKC